MIKHVLVFLIGWAVLASPALAWNQPDRFQGVRWDASTADARKIAADRGEPFRFCFEAFPYQVCSTSAAVGPVDSTILFLFRDDKLVSGQLSFKASDFDAMKTQFIERYGPPTTQVEEPFDTKDAMKSVNRVLRWGGNAVLIELRAHGGGSVEMGTASIATKPEADRVAAERAKAKPKGKRER